MPQRSDIGTAVTEIIALTKDANTRPMETNVSGLFVIGGEVPAYQLAALYQPMIGLVIQGTKRMSIGDRSIEVNGPAYFLLPMHLPVTATVHTDREGRPYRSLGLELDQTVLKGLIRDIAGERTIATSSKFAACSMDRDITDALLRLIRLKDRDEISALASAYKREIFYRVLAGPQGDSLRQMAVSESDLSRIARSVQWIRKNYDRPIEVGDVARETGMAVTTFHRQFKLATGLSPIQFQKQLRLLEARNLIAYDGLAVSNAAFQVGYESPSQFNREYSRFFGTSPSKHGVKIRGLEAART